MVLVSLIFGFGFVHSSRRSYYLFFNYLSYYLYGVPATAKNRGGECIRNSVENSLDSPAFVEKHRHRKPRERFSAGRRPCTTPSGVINASLARPAAAPSVYDIHQSGCPTHRRTRPREAWEASTTLELCRTDKDMIPENTRISSPPNTTPRGVGSIHAAQTRT